MKIVIKVILSLVLIIGSIFLYRIISDQNSARHIKTTILDIENFYTKNNKYPDSLEFKELFPNLNTDIDYWPNSIQNIENNPPHAFTFLYRLSINPGYAFMRGKFYRDDYSNAGTYRIEPCPRWEKIGLHNPEGFFLISSNNLVVGIIEVNFDKGNVFFAPKETLSALANKDYSNISILLSNLKQPRIFYDYEKGDRMYVTDGEDIFSYDINTKELTPSLENPSKIGRVPKGCPAGWFD